VSKKDKNNLNFLIRQKCYFKFKERKEEKKNLKKEKKRKRTKEKGGSSRRSSPRPFSIEQPSRVPCFMF
jgi:hypothetical protein